MAPGAMVRQSAAQSLTNDLDRRRAARRAVVPGASLAERPAREAAHAKPKPSGKPGD